MPIELDQSQNPEPTERKYQVQFVFDATHYGRLDQVERLRERLERELFLALSQPVHLRVNSQTEIDLPQNDDVEVVGADEEG